MPRDEQDLLRLFRAARAVDRRLVLDLLRAMQRNTRLRPEEVTAITAILYPSPSPSGGP